jgi:hypothetical protein
MKLLFTISISCCAAASVQAADIRPDSEPVAEAVQSGPAAGTELPIFKSERVSSSACVHCAMT